MYDVVEALCSSGGANIPTDIEVEEIGTSSYATFCLLPEIHNLPEGKEMAGQQ